jgi:sterol desaturase/sphingolipid hydroxylase (fatty acid hydroxylase superfamily)
LETVQHWDGTLLRPSTENRSRESVRVFKADWFEQTFATAHPILPGAFWGPVVLACIYFNSLNPRIGFWASAGVFVLGFLAWTLLEYVLHRFMFHIAPEPTFESKLKQFMVHGYHHEFPNDRMRLVAPLILSGPIAVVTAGLYYFLAGPHHWLMAFAGTVTGYVAYDWIHYYTHHFRPTTRLGKFLRRYHMEHHYKDSESHFGISTPIWDWVFGTARGRGEGTEPAREALEGPQG